MPAPLHLRIFLASPGDVADERALALKVLDRLQYDPLLRGRITVEAVAWDKPGTDTPMLATLTPQEAIQQGLPKPSKCDIVVVIFWSRMGTPLPKEWTKPDGGRYQSGTEWEYWDAMNAARENGRPAMLVYRRTERVLLDPDDPEFKEKHHQWKQVKAFFESFVDPEDQSIRGGINEYATPDEFRDRLGGHLRELISRLLDESGPKPTAEPSAPEPPLWEGSPFPGLRPFTTEDAPIFFGRGRETDELISRLTQKQSFIAVVGASGSGKSSLVAAGLLPRLIDNSIPGSRDWAWVRFTPGEYGHNPFVALAAGFKPLLEKQGRKLRDEAERLSQDPQALDELVNLQLEGRPEWAEILLFVDQFEELFTVVDRRHREPFIALLQHIAHATRVRTLVTLRADFYPRCVAQPVLAEQLRAGSYPLAAPGIGALYEMITGPAARAGLRFEEELAERILDDTGTEPGALPLMAFALAELYETRQPDGLLTHAAYEGFGGVQGAISQRAEDTFGTLDQEAQTTLDRVFRELVEVEETETGWVATRRRAFLDEVATTPAAERLVAAFTEARLLVQGRGEEDRPVVEVAHEALLRNWPTLVEWIKDNGEALHIRRECREAARDWRQQNREEGYLYRGARLSRAEAWAQRYSDMVGDDERAFLEASVDLRDKELKQREEQRKHELEMARQLAEKERQRAQESERRRQEVTHRVHQLEGAILVILVSVIVILYLYWMAEAAQKDAIDKLVNIHWVSGVNERDRDDGPLKAAHHFMQVAELTYDPVEKKNAYLAGALLTKNIQLVDILEHQHRFLHAEFHQDKKNQILTWRVDGAAQVWNIGNEGPRGPRTLPIRHQESIDGFVFSRDGTRIVTWDQTGLACVWSSADGRPIRCLRHNEPIRDAFFIPGQNRILTLGKDNAARVWDIQDGASPALLLQHERNGSTIREASFSRDGSRILTWGDDHIVRVWSAENEASPSLRLQHEEKGLGISQAMFNKDGDRILTANHRTARIWDSRTGREISAFRHDARIKGVAFSQDETRILTWGEDNTARLWNSRNEELLTPPLKHQSWVNGAAFFCRDDWILTWSEDSTARLWDGRNGEPINPPMQHSGPVTRTDFICDRHGKSDRILTRGEHGSIRVWDSQGWQPLIQVLEHDSGIKEAAFGRNGGRILVLSVDAKPQFLDGQDWNALIPTEYAQHFQDAIFSQDKSHLLTWRGDGTVRVWDIQSGKLLTNSPIRHSLASMQKPVISQNGSRVLTWNRDGSLQVWDNQGNRFFTLIPENSEFLGATFGHGANRILTWSSDGTARVWDGHTGELLTDPPLKREAYIFSGGIFNPDGTQIVTWSEFDNAQLWDSQSNQSLTLKHEGAVNGAAFSQDGRRILTWGSDNHARVWDSSGQLLLLLEHESAVNGAMFSRNGSQILSWAQDDTARLWDNQSGKLLTVMRHKPSFRGVLGAAFSHDNGQILTWGGDLTVRLWDLNVDVRPDDPTLELEIRTGTYLDQVNAINVLSYEEWQPKMQRGREVKGGFGLKSWLQMFSEFFQNLSDFWKRET